MNLEAIDGLAEAEARNILRTLFTHYASPAFGALPQREADLLVFAAMREAKVVREDASLYELMTGLRITRAKARNLLFDIEIRQDLTGGGLDAEAKKALARPKGFVKDGNYIALGIENPVVQAHLKERIRNLGHLTDASFDSSIVKMKSGALAALVEALMTEDELANFKDAMIDAGLEKDKSVKAVLKAGLEHIAGLAVGEEAAETGKVLMEPAIDSLADFVQPTAQKAVARISRMLRKVFERSDDGQPDGEVQPQVRPL